MSPRLLQRNNSMPYQETRDPRFVAAFLIGCAATYKTYPFFDTPPSQYVIIGIALAYTALFFGAMWLVVEVFGNWFGDRFK